jgi:LmbE family N-acetylglucosaminyl deacetylase
MMSEPKKKLLAIFAHPDDESIMMGGALAMYANRGVEVYLLCATRGEWGNISNDNLATQENLGEVRECELRAACEVLGITLQGFLDCPDSNINNTDWTIIEEKIVRAIRTIQPQVIVSFGLDGLYGHPDHIAVSMLTKASYKSAGEEIRFPQHAAEGIKPFQADKFYYALYPDFLMRELFASENIASDAWGFDADCFGVPFAEITTVLDVSETFEVKMKALKSHQTQLDETNIFAIASEENARKFLSKEYFRLVCPEVKSDKSETDLFEKL